MTVCDSVRIRMCLSRTLFFSTTVKIFIPSVLSQRRRSRVTPPTLAMSMAYFYSLLLNGCPAAGELHIDATWVMGDSLAMRIVFLLLFRRSTGTGLHFLCWCCMWAVKSVDFDLRWHSSVPLQDRACLPCVSCYLSFDVHTLARIKNTTDVALLLFFQRPHPCRNQRHVL